MIVFFSYILIGWIVASAVLLQSVCNTDETELVSDFVLPFLFWPIIVVVFMIWLIYKIIIWPIMLLGRITEKTLLKLLARAASSKER